MACHGPSGTRLDEPRFLAGEAAGETCDVNAERWDEAAA